MITLQEEFERNVFCEDKSPPNVHLKLTKRFKTDVHKQDLPQATSEQHLVCQIHKLVSTQKKNYIHRAS